MSNWCGYHQTDDHSEGSIKCNPPDRNDVDYERLRKAGIPVAVIPRDSFLGIDPDYGNHVPEPKTLTVEKLIEGLNKEAFPWDKHQYAAHLSIDWIWQTDTILPVAVMLFLSRDKENIAILNTTSPWADFKVDGMQILGVATVDDLRFIREVTGWKIEI